MGAQAAAGGLSIHRHRHPKSKQQTLSQTLIQQQSTATHQPPPAPPPPPPLVLPPLLVPPPWARPAPRGLQPPPPAWAPSPLLPSPSSRRPARARAPPPRPPPPPPAWQRRRRAPYPPPSLLPPAPALPLPLLPPPCWQRPPPARRCETRRCPAWPWPCDHHGGGDGQRVNNLVEWCWSGRDVDKGRKRTWQGHRLQLPPGTGTLLPAAGRAAGRRAWMPQRKRRRRGPSRRRCRLAAPSCARSASCWLVVVMVV